MTPIEPIRKSVTIRRTPAEAFELFTGTVNQWWPLRTHSVSKERAVRVIFEPGPRGRVYEVRDDGQEIVWGAILKWEPPNFFSMTWHPGRGEETAQLLELRFVANGDNTTSVELEHTGWEKLADGAGKARTDYDGGWNGVLEACSNWCTEK
jgi:uncharacterized protein YndB with AHSA1/START domain